MNFNKPLLTYLFKEGFKNDQSSVGIKAVLKTINEEIKDESIYNTETEKDLHLQTYLIETKLERINHLLSKVEQNIIELDEEVRERLVSIRLRLLESKDLVKQAMLAERTLTGETYTLQIPLDPTYSTDSTTTTFEDNVVFGIGYDDKKTSNRLDVDLLNIRSEEETRFTLKRKKYPLELDFEENFYKPYNQVNLTVSKLTQTGLLFIGFSKAEVISVLDDKGFEIIAPHISDKISVPISHGLNNIKIRFGNNKRRTVRITDLYFTEAVYNKVTIFETVPLLINKDLSFISLQTCDNYSNLSVDLDYEISINGGEYRKFRPNGKLSTKKYNSILKTREISPKITKISYTDKNGSNYRFYNEELININAKVFSFTRKLGEDFLSFENYMDTTIEEYSFHTYNSETFILKLSPSMFVYLDNILVRYEDVIDGEVVVKKGIHSLRVKPIFWKEIVDLDKYEVTGIEKESLLIKRREDGEMIRVDNYFSTDSFLSNSIYLQLKKVGCEIFLDKKELKRKYDKDYIEYFYKEDPLPIYILAEAYQASVSTVQVKVTMQSLDNRTCPFVSRILLKGV